MKKRKIIVEVIIGILLMLGLFIIIFYSNITNWLSMSYSKSNFRNLLEIIYFIVSPLLLIVTVIGLKQIKIAKDAIKINSKRESLTLAAEQCKYYYQHIIPLQNNLDNQMQMAGIKNLGDAEVKLDSDGKNISYKYKINKQLHDYKSKFLITEVTDVLNVMEGFCIFFTAKAADESIAFSSVGSTFISSVEEFLPIICLAQKSRYYQNILMLYIKWRDRSEKLDALIRKNEAEVKLSQECKIDMTSIGI